MLKIATQGQPASFHYQACEAFFKDQGISVLGFNSFGETFAALSDGQADYAVVAVENSIHGAINEAYDLLDEHHLWICGEQYLQIRQCLITLPHVALTDITEVHSHFAALSQCRQYLDQHLPKAQRLVHPDTAGAVADVKKWGDPHKAAIASAFAAHHYNLPVMAENIETNHHNYTRFALLSRTHRTPANATKTTLLLQFHSHIGALHEVLGILASHQLDMSMLVSRPIVGQPGNYRFYIDVNAAASSPHFSQALTEITAQGYTLRTLGSFCPMNSVETLVAE